jgi:2-dehydropantoate 2-reductase
MKILVMGSGGVGGYFGARLQQAGHDVTYVARGRHLDALRRSGLKLRSAAGDAQLAVKALEQPADAGAPDVVLFAVKLWDTESAAQQLAATRGYVIPFQNGVESVERIGRILGPERVLGGAAYIAARIGSPGEIVHTGTMARLRFGPVLPAQRPVAEQLLQACRDAKVEAELSDDIVRALWEKFVLLVAVSASTTVARRSVGVVRADPDMRWMLESAMRETWQVGRARGVALADDLVAKALAAVDGLPHEMKASMLGDLEAGGRLEAPWLSGAVVRMAREAALDAPVNRTVLAALKPFIDGSARQAS